MLFSLCEFTRKQISKIVVDIVIIWIHSTKQADAIKITSFFNTKTSSSVQLCFIPGREHGTKLALTTLHHFILCVRLRGDCHIELSKRTFSCRKSNNTGIISIQLTNGFFVHRTVDTSKPDCAFLKIANHRSTLGINDRTLDEVIAFIRRLFIISICFQHLCMCRSSAELRLCNDNFMFRSSLCSDRRLKNHREPAVCHALRAGLRIFDEVERCSMIGVQCIKEEGYICCTIDQRRNFAISLIKTHVCLDIKIIIRSKYVVNPIG